MPHPPPDLLENVLDVMSDHVYMLRLDADGGLTVVYANEALSSFMQMRRSQLQGRRLDEIMDNPDAYQRIRARYLKIARLCEPQHYEETSEGFGNGSIEYFDTRLAPVLDAHGQCTHICGISRNITLRREAENALRQTNEELAVRLREIEILQTQLREQAIRDPLTGVFNRRYLQESLQRELSRARRENYPVSLLMLDVDHFKPFNDAFGHQAGDMALMALAQHLSRHTRAEDVICRFGGEEFIILIHTVQPIRPLNASRTGTTRLSASRYLIPTVAPWTLATRWDCHNFRPTAALARG